MDLHDLEQVAVALAEDGLNTGLELLEAVVRDERQAPYRRSRRPWMRSAPRPWSSFVQSASVMAMS